MNSHSGTRDSLGFKTNMALMNTSFGNRYANTYFSTNNKGEAMRKMRQGVRLPGWGLPMNGGQTRSATYLNQYAGSADDLLKKLEEEIGKQENEVRERKFLMPTFIYHKIKDLDKMKLTPAQEMRFETAKRRMEKLVKEAEAKNLMPAFY